MTTPTILLTFDVEEFDLPLEHGQHIAEAEQLEVGYAGLKNILTLLEKYPEVSTTMFTTANFADHNQALFKSLSENHEIASHLYYHSDYNEAHLATSKVRLEEIIGKKVYGFRSPRFERLSAKAIKDAGYFYDSSINPTCVPGRYNYLGEPTVYRLTQHGFWEIPLSVSPILRLPLFWLSLKHFSVNYYLFLCDRFIKKHGYLHLYFHPWEFTDIKAYKIPHLISRRSGQGMLDRLERVIKHYQKRGANFTTVKDFLEQKIDHR